MKKIALFALVTLLACLFPALLLADALVTVVNGQVTAGLAVKWSAKNDTTTVFTLKDPKAAEIAPQLAKELEGKATVTVVNDLTIEVAGLPASKAFETVAAIDIKMTEAAVAKNDPFAALGGGSGAVALEVPDGSQSLRARKKADLGTEVQPQAASFKAKVLNVNRGPFPGVILELLILTAPTKSELGIKRTQRITVKPMYGDMNLENPLLQKNLVACYVQKGDVVTVNITGKDGADFLAQDIERVR